MTLIRRSLYYLIMMVIFFSFIPMSSSYATTIQKNDSNGENYSTNSEALNEVYSLLDNYKREEAYDLLLTMYENTSYEASPDLYLEILSILIELEEHFWIVDQLSFHAVDLYNLSSENNQPIYQMHALNAIATIEYYSFENTISSERLNEMLSLSDHDPTQKYLIYYHIGFAMLSGDEQDYEVSLEHLELAKSLLNNNNDTNKINQPILHEINDLLAFYKTQLNDFDSAITIANDTILLINENDLETLMDCQINLLDYYLHDNNFIQATLLLDEIDDYYSNLSDTYKNIYPKDIFTLYRASIAYNEGSYEQAANLYTHYYWKNDIEYNSLDAEVTSHQTMSAFATEEIENQLALYKQLQISQDQNIRMLVISLVITGLLLLAVVIILINTSRQRHKLHNMSITDQLTQLNNRRMIMTTFDKMKPGQGFIVLLDLDHFKQINDIYGHLFGDVVLERVAMAIKDSIRGSDFIGRYGGEEFMMILNTSSRDIAEGIMSRVLTNIEALDWEHDIITTASAGMVYSPSIIGDPLIKAADDLMYEAKNAGRNQYKFEYIS